MSAGHLQMLHRLGSALGEAADICVRPRDQHRAFQGPSRGERGALGRIACVEQPTSCWKRARSPRSASPPFGSSIFGLPAAAARGAFPVPHRRIVGIPAACAGRLIGYPFSQQHRILPICRRCEVRAR
jgi:hypothetical protein